MSHKGRYSLIWIADQLSGSNASRWLKSIGITTSLFWEEIRIWSITAGCYLAFQSSWICNEDSFLLGWLDEFFIGFFRTLRRQPTRRLIRQWPALAGRHSDPYRRACSQWHASVWHQPLLTSVQRLCLEDLSTVLWNRFDQTASDWRLEAARCYVRCCSSHCSIQTWNTVHIRLGDSRSSPGREHLQSGEHPQRKFVSLVYREPIERSWFVCVSRFRSLPSIESFEILARNLWKRWSIKRRTIRWIVNYVPCMVNHGPRPRRPSTFLIQVPNHRRACILIVGIRIRNTSLPRAKHPKT